jgi:hypothetical protein
LLVADPNLLIPRHVELRSQNRQFRFALRPRRRGAPAKLDVLENLVDLFGRCHDQRKRLVGLMLVLKYVQHPIYLVPEKLYLRFRVFFLAGLADRALTDCGIEVRLELLAVFFTFSMSWSLKRA